MAFTSADLDRIDRAISNGELSCTLDGKSVTYRSIAELLKARSLIKDAVNVSSGATTSRVSFYSRVRT